MNSLNVVRFLTALTAGWCYLTTMMDEEVRQAFMLSAFGLNLDPAVRRFEFVWASSGNITIDTIYTLPYHTGYPFTIQHVGVAFFTLLFVLTFVLSKSKSIKVIRAMYGLSSLVAIGLGIAFYIRVQDANYIRLGGYGLMVVSYLILMCCSKGCKGATSDDKKKSKKNQ